MGIVERRPREREARISQVLDAARLLLLERGFSGTTTNLIARQCESSEATLFFSALRKIQKLKSEPEIKLRKIWQLFEKVRKEHPEYYLLSAYLARPKATANISVVRKNNPPFLACFWGVTELLTDEFSKLIITINENQYKPNCLGLRRVKYV